MLQYANITILLVITSDLISCGPSPDFITKHGIHVYRHDTDITHAEVDAIADYFLEFTPEVTYGYTRKSIERVYKGERIHFSAEPIPCDEPPGTCHGTFSGKVIDVFKRDGECIASTALAHEFAHLLHWGAGPTKIVDYNHERTGWWGADGLVGLVNRNACLDLCAQC